MLLWMFFCCIVWYSSPILPYLRYTEQWRCRNLRWNGVLQNEQQRLLLIQETEDDRLFRDKIKACMCLCMNVNRNMKQAEVVSMGCSGTFLLIASTCILVLLSTNSLGESLSPISCKQLPVDIVGISVTPHLYSHEMRWRRSPSEELGALVRLFISHRHTSEKAFELELEFNRKRPSELLCRAPSLSYMER